MTRTLARLLRRLADWIERPRLIYGMPPLRDIPPPPPRRVRTPLEAGYQPAPADPGAGAPNDPPRAP